MLDKLLSFVAPHICCGCGKIGGLLCDNCKEDIIREPFSQCLGCRRPTLQQGVCASCQLPYQMAWCVGERSGTLQHLIGQYKFANARAAYRPLGDILDSVVPILPATTVIVPIPTVAAHIRQRGYDHTLLMARYVARRRNLPLEQYLTRTHTTTQRGASRAQRIRQAKKAFGCTQPLDATLTYVIVDDVATTGATVRYAAQALRQAGAQSVAVAVIAHQPLD